MRSSLIISNIGQLVTCASDGKPRRGRSMQDVGIIENAAVAVIDGNIAACGPSSEVVKAFNAEQSIDAGGRVVCPAFVDPHTHIVFSGERFNEFELKIKGTEYLEILANGGGIISTVRQTRESSLDELIERSGERLDKMLRSGTATVEIKTGYGLDVETELKMLAAIELLDKRHAADIVPTFLAAHAIPPEFKDNADGYTDLICDEMLPKAWAWYKNSHFYNNVSFFADVFCEKNAFSLDQSKRVLEASMALGFKLKAHVDEFTNLGGSRLSIELGAVSIDHLDVISDSEIEMLAGSNTIGIVTPTVNFNFGSSEFADARKLIDRGCAVALSTDFNPGSAPCPSQPMAMAIACRYQKLLPSEALNAVTINAAHAVGLGDKIGSLEVGKQADMLILASKDHREIAYEFGGNLVDRIFKSGRDVSSTFK
ncbi:MAG: imidazolonepropionase [Pyrinomonadaceae bacterium]